MRNDCFTFLVYVAQEMETSPITSELFGEGNIANFDYDRNIEFCSESRNQLLDTPRRASFETMSVRAERSFPVNVPQRVYVPNGLTIKVNFNKETPLVRTKIETIINYVHMHLTTKLNEKEMVN
jgi:hypothetical protein